MAPAKPIYPPIRPPIRPPIPQESSREIGDDGYFYKQRSGTLYKPRYAEPKFMELRYVDTRDRSDTPSIKLPGPCPPLPADETHERPFGLPPRSSAKHATVSDPHMDGSSDNDSIQSMSINTRGRSHSGSRSRESAASTPKDQNNLSLMRRPIVKDDIVEELEQLRRENERLRQERTVPSPQAAHPASTYKIFHYIGDICYLDEPQWVPGDGSPRLRASNPIRNIHYYLDQHPDIAFTVYKTYASRAPADLAKIETKDGVFRKPEPKTQNLSFISQTMIEAVEEFVEKVPHFDYFFPYFNPRRQIKAPYLFMYYSAPYMPEILPIVDGVSRYLLEQLDECIQKSHGIEHISANSRFAKGLVTKILFKYLVRPGDVLVHRAGPQTKAYLAEDWAKEVIEDQESVSEDFDDWHEYTRNRAPKRGVNAYDIRTYRWKVPVWSWEFDGHFHKNRENLVLEMKAGDAMETVPIEQLIIIPLRFASPGLRESLEKRGRTFWHLRHRKFVTYQQSEDDALNNVNFFPHSSILATTNH